MQSRRLRREARRPRSEAPAAAAGRNGARLPLRPAISTRIAGRSARAWTGRTAQSPKRPLRASRQAGSASARWINPIRPPGRARSAQARIPGLEPVLGREAWRRRPVPDREGRCPGPAKKGGFVSTRSALSGTSPAARRAAPEASRSASITETRPSRLLATTFSRAQGGEGGSRSTSTTRHSGTRCATVRPTAPVAAPRSATVPPLRCDPSGEQHRIGAGAVRAARRLVQGQAPAEEAIRLSRGRHRAVRRRGRHR